MSIPNPTIEQCEHCMGAIEAVGFDYVVLIGGSNEASPEAFYHPCCAQIVTKRYVRDCCEKHYLEGRKARGVDEEVE